MKCLWSHENAEVKEVVEEVKRGKIISENSSGGGMRNLEKSRIRNTKIN
jgi:hypothetical protein